MFLFSFSSSSCVFECTVYPLKCCQRNYMEERNQWNIYSHYERNFIRSKMMTLRKYFLFPTLLVYSTSTDVADTVVVFFYVFCSLHTSSRKKKWINRNRSFWNKFVRNINKFYLSFIQILGFFPNEKSILEEWDKTLRMRRESGNGEKTRVNKSRRKRATIELYASKNLIKLSTTQTSSVLI